MPPRRYTALDRARQEALGEAPPAYYFPAVNGSGHSPFAPTISPQYAARQMLEREAIDAHRDDALTKAEDNAFRRLTNESKRRSMPFTEAAEIAKAKLAATQAATDEANNPFTAEADKQQALTNIEQNQGLREDLPEVREYAKTQRAHALQQMQDQDPYFTRLSKILPKNDVASAAAYESYLRNPPPGVQGERARQHAYESTLSLVRDSEAVDAIDTQDAMAKNSALRDELLEDVPDAETGQIIGTRIKKGANMTKVTAALRAARNAKRLDARENRERRAISDYDHLRLKLISGKIDDLLAANKNTLTDDDIRNANAAKIAQLYAEADAITAAAAPQGASPGAPAPGAAVGNPKAPWR